MRIAIACSGLDGSPPELDAWAIDLGRALAARREKVVLFKPTGDEREPHECTLPGRGAVFAPARRLLRRIPRLLGRDRGPGDDDRIADHDRFARALIGPLREGRFDVLHVREPRVAQQIQRARRLGRLKTRTVLMHGPEGSPVDLKPFAYVHHLAPAPPEGAQRIDAWRSTWTAIPRFVDTAAYKPGRADALRIDLGIPTTAVVVLACSPIGRDRDRVNRVIDETATLLARDADSPVHLIIAGPRTPETPEMIARARAALRDRVRVLADLPRGCLPDLYRAADLFTLGTLRDEMPTAALEAIATGLPAVLHHHPTLQRIVGPGGVPVDLEVPGALASTLAALALDPPRRHQIGIAARAHCLHAFDQDRVVDQVLDYYREILLDDCLRKRSEKLSQSFSMG